MSEEPKGVWQKFRQRMRRFLAVIFLLAAVACIAATLAALATDGWRHVKEDLRLIVWFGLIGAACGVVVLYPIPRFFSRLILRFMRALFTRRFWKLALIVLACLAILVALFYAEEDLRGKWAWEKYKRAWEAKGEKFDLVSLAPPPVPDGQNFAMTRLLKTIFDYDVLTNANETEDRVRHRDTNAWAKVQGTDAYLWVSSTQTNPIYGNLDRGIFTDLESVRMFYRGNENYPQPTESKSVAEDILAAFAKFDAEFSELQEAAAARPLTRFPIAYDYDPPSSILLPHLSVIKKISICAELRAIARLELGRGKEASTELNLCFRLSESVRQEPILISHLVRIATLNVALQIIREGLARHVWNDEQLIGLEDHLAAINLLAEFRQAIRGERAANLGDIDYLRRMKWNLHFNMFTFNETEPQWHWRDFIVRFTPDGWIRQNQLTIAQIDQMEVDAVDANAHRIDFERELSVELAAAKLRNSPYQFLARMIVPATLPALKKSVRSQTYVDAARCACAVERYRLTNGELPKNLDALVPRFIDKIPNDVIDGQPLRYHPAADGNYLIYSIGWNKIDDGGERYWKFPEKKLAPDFEKGDWVWSSSAP